MSRPDENDANTSSVELPTMALSPTARAVGEALSQWRSRIAETQTLGRLTLSLLQGGDGIALERRSHLGRLLRVEGRTLALLPRLDFASLRTTTHARESGVDLRGADTILAERYFVNLRGEVTHRFAGIADAVVACQDDAAVAGIEQGRRALDELSRLLEMLETMMYPRVQSPAIEVGLAVERAAASRGQTSIVEGDVTASVSQVRGLLRLLAEVMDTVGGRAYVHVAHGGGWIELSVSSSVTGTGELTLPAERVEVLRFAAYLLRVHVRFEQGAWQMSFVAADS